MTEIDVKSDTTSDSDGIDRLYDCDAPASDQREALTSGEVPVGVYGLGKMGMPLAAVYADVTRNVKGADVDPEVVRRVNAGRSPIEGEPGLDDLVSDLVDDGALEAFEEPWAVASESSVHVVIVPTLIDDDNRVDLAAVEAVTQDVADELDPGDLVIYESTLPPRATRDELLPALEERSGLSLGEFGVAFCPERTKSGRALEDIRGAHPKIVGGADDESTRVAELVYGELSSNDVIAVDDTTTAEAVKVFEGVYRDVNIALANELGRHADAFGIDVTQAIDAANTQPVCDIHTPGAGVGGHCIPYYPHFIIQQFDTDTRVMQTAREVNEYMPVYTAEQALDGLRAEGIDPADATVLVLGLTYRPGVREIRATPALPAIERLDAAGCDVRAVDPVLDEYDAFEDAGATVLSVDEVGDDPVDAAVLVTPQAAFDDLDVASLGPDGDGRRLVVVDGRQALTALRGDDAVRYRGIGLDD